MIKGNFNANDLISAHWVHLRPRRSLAVVGVILFALMLWALAISLRPPVSYELGVGRWILPGSLVYGMVWFGALVPYRARRTFRQRKDLQRETAFVASEAGLAASNEYAQGSKPWADFLKWKEGKHVFLLYLSDGMYQIVPKRFFSSDSDMDEFRRLLGKYVPRAKS